MPKDAEPDFLCPALARAVEALTQAEIDVLPYGVIRLNGAGLVTFYSRAEGELSGYGPTPPLGLDFFAEVAPCMRSEAFRGRLQRGLVAGSLDIAFTWVGDFNDRDRLLEIRAQGATGGGCWIFLRREE